MDVQVGGMAEKHEVQKNPFVIFQSVNVHVTYQDMPPPAHSIASTSLSPCSIRPMLKNTIGVFC